MNVWDTFPISKTMTCDQCFVPADVCCQMVSCRQIGIGLFVLVSGVS